VIETLRIEGMAIVDRVELTFGPGLNVLTGETGAGKSIVLGALALLAGARGSVQTVRDGAEEAVVEAEFDTTRLPELEQQLALREIETDEHQLVVRRSIARSGRSRARLAGQSMPVTSLAEIFAGRLEISSQHDSQTLLRPEAHGRLLDRMGGLTALRGAIGAGCAALRALDAELARLRADAQERVRLQEFLAFQVNEIDAAELDAEAIAGIRRERGRLAHAERLQREGASALAAIAGDPTGAEDASAADRLAGAAGGVKEMAELDPELGELAARLASVQDELREAGYELERYVSAIEADPERLAEIDERLHQVEQLQRKYGASVEEVLCFRDRAAAELGVSAGADEREAAILSERAQRSAAVAADAEQLSAGRARAARKLAKVVQASLRELGMPQGRFEVALEPVAPPEGMPCGSAGAEAPDFRFSANAGEELRPLRAVASGGELSRVFLALKQALREAETGMVLVFDEVDAGVGGRTADRVGRMLAELAGHHQVLCITHLPQIAAFAQCHFRVAKRSRKGRTETCITRVEGAERVEEIARMAGGEEIGEATLEHARELLAARANL
jgi:DNA repair protein RecN (Recombination protein N)